MPFRSAVRPLCAALAVAGLALSAPPTLAQAQSGATDPMMPGMASPMTPGATPSVTLTDEKVRGFIQSYPTVTAKMDEIETKYNLPKSGNGSPAQTWQAMATYREISGELDGLVDDYGFASYGEWVQTAMTIAMAHAFARKGGNLDSQMAETIAQVENNPDIPAAQKEMILQQLQAQSQMMAGVRPSEENVAVVGRFTSELDQLFDKN